MKKYLVVVFFLFSLPHGKTQSLMTVREIYDYNIGDIFSTRAGGYDAPPIYVNKIITNKYYSSMLDTLFYIYDAYSYTPPACSACVAVYDTTYGNLISYINLDDTVGAGLGTPPHYWAIDCIDTAGYTGIWVDSIYYDSTFCNIHTIRISRMGNGPQLTDSCYSYFEPFWGYDEYGAGVGLKSHYYNTCSQGFPFCQEGLFLIFYKKGTDSCGTAPIIPLPANINDLKFPMSFIISPNPATNIFTIKNISSNEASLLQIINPIGEIVYTEKLYGRKEYVIDANLAKGIYFVKVKDVTGKLVVE